MKNDILRLRPHHILDIVRSYGQGRMFTPHPLGHALHEVAQKLLNDLDQSIELVVAADAICEPCSRLNPGGTCSDVLPQLDEKPSKQEYNDRLDEKLLPCLGLAEGAVMTLREYLKIVNSRIPGVEKICTHPKEDQAERLAGMIEGLKKLGIRP